MSPAESAARLRPGKALRVYSFPKAGRTWLSHLWFHYASVLAGRSDLTREAAGSVRSFWRPTQDPRFQAEVRDVLHARGLGSLTFSHAFSPLDGRRKSPPSSPAATPW